MMKSKLTDDTKKRAVKQAQSALRANLDIADEPTLLGIIFHRNIWSVGYMETRLTVARIAEDRFRFWRYHENGGVWGSAPGEYQTPSLGSPAQRAHTSILIKKRVRASQLGLFARIREWFKRRSK